MSARKPTIRFSATADSPSLPIIQWRSPLASIHMAAVTFEAANVDSIPSRPLWVVAFRPGDAAFSLEETGENELVRLSRSINRVFDLNREDQEELKQTVTRLEDAMARLKHAQQEIIRAEKLATVRRLSSGVAH